MICKNCTHKGVCKYKAKFHKLIKEEDLDGLKIEITECDHTDTISVASFVPGISCTSNSTMLLNNSIVPESITLEDDSCDEPDAIEHYMASSLDKDYNKISEMIKSSYKDVKSERMVCPSCGTEVSEIFKCVECGKPTCLSCGTMVNTINPEGSAMLCEECDKSLEDMNPISEADMSYITNIVKSDIPEK